MHQHHHRTTIHPSRQYHHSTGPLVQEGLTMLVNYPFDALDISIESQTVDVRKAYKKMALKYRE